MSIFLSGYERESALSKVGGGGGRGEEGRREREGRERRETDGQEE